MSSQPKLSILFTRNEIEATVKRLAAEIKKDYPGKSPLLVGILKGSFMFMADLIRLLDFPLEVDFIRLSSYGKGRESSGKITKLLIPIQTIANQKLIGNSKTRIINSNWSPPPGGLISQGTKLQ